jgi:hypothetical protein
MICKVAAVWDVIVLNRWIDQEVYMVASVWKDIKMFGVASGDKAFVAVL